MVSTSAESRFARAVAASARNRRSSASSAARALRTSGNAARHSCRVRAAFASSDTGTLRASAWRKVASSERKLRSSTKPRTSSASLPAAAAVSISEKTGRRSGDALIPSIVPHRRAEAMG